MRRTKVGTWTAWLLAICCLGTMAASAAEAEVRDNAGLFSSAAVKQANEVIRTIRRDFRKDLVVETFAGVPEGKAADYARNREGFFATLVNERATAARVEGIYVLVMKEPPPHRFRIQVGVGQATRQRSFQPADRDGLVRTFQERFREDKFDEGLLAAVGYVERTLRNNSRAGGSPAGRQPAATAPAASSSFSFGSLLGMALLAVGGILVIGFLARLFRGGGVGGGLTGAGAGGMPGSAGGRGGFLPGLLGGIGGAIAGSWLYNQFLGGNAHAADHHSSLNQAEPPSSDLGGDYSSSGGDVDLGGGGDFGGGGGDFGGGGGDA